MSMYDTSDPRSALNAAPKSSVKPATEFAAAEYAKFYETAPQEDDGNGKTWYARGQNFIIAYTEAKPGATFGRLAGRSAAAFARPPASRAAQVRHDAEGAAP